MKKIIALVLAIVMCVSLCACGKTYEIGETINSGNFSYVIKEAKVVDSIKYGADTDADFFTPDGAGEKDFVAPGGNSLLYFVIEYTYTGSEVEDSDIAKFEFVPAVKCKGGKVDSNFMMYTSKDGQWYNLNSDISWASREAAGLGLYSLSFDLEPGETETHVIRGCIYIPTKAAEKTSSKITLFMGSDKISVR